jgi:2-keto-4-pentenoate hydratase/2-oxohepta-3-ene-1,7-dioic acid hydratase in catechol pathway
MRLVTFAPRGAAARIGAALGPWDGWESILDLRAADRVLPDDMIAFVDACGPLSGTPWARAKAAVERASRGRASRGLHDPRRVKVLAPIRPRLLRDFLAFRGHVVRTRAAMGSQVPREWDLLPAYYNGNHLSVVGPGDPVAIPTVPSASGGTAPSSRFDYEAEIGFVLGRGGRSIARARAGACLFGVTIFNDFSARDVQVLAGKVGMGPAPAKDSANALGPCIVTRDEFGPLGDQRVVTRVNGRTRLDGRYRELVHENPNVKPGERALWSFEEMVEVLSSAQALHPGEVWGSGTIPGGCELERGESAEYLKPGDDVAVEIEGIGVLENRIASRARKG